MKLRIALLLGAFLAVPPAGAVGESLDDAISRALAGDPSLASARTTLDAARAAVSAARAERLPDLNGSVSYSSAWNNGGGGVIVAPDGTVIGRGGASSTSESASAGLNISDTLFAGGRISAGIAQARADEARTAAEVRGQEDSLILEVVQAYTSVAYGEAAVQIRRDSVQRLLREVDAAKVRFEAGAATRTDVYQAQAQLAAARSDLATAQADLASARATYARRVGAMPGTLAPAAPPATPATLDQAIDATRANATQIEASAAAVRSAHARTQQAVSGYLPSLTLSAAANRRGDSGFEGFDNDDTSLTARLSIPLFSFGRTSAAVSQAKANERGARYSLDDSVRAAEESTAQAWARLDAARLRVDTTKAQLEAASFAARGAEIERREGLRTELEVLDQIQNERDAGLAVAQAQRDLVTTAYQLLQAMGVTPRPATPAAPRPR